MADYGGDIEYQEEIKNLLFKISIPPSARAIQAAARIGHIAVPDKQLIEELTNLSRKVSDESVRDSILGALERIGRKPIRPVSDEKEQSPDAIVASTEKIEPVVPLENSTKSQTKKCPFCAEEIKKEAVVCRHCGWLVANRKPCPTCGRSIPRDIVKCPYCVPPPWGSIFGIGKSENPPLTELTALELGGSLRPKLKIFWSVFGSVFCGIILAWLVRSLFWGSHGLR